MKSYYPIECEKRCDSALACSWLSLFIERGPKNAPSEPCPDPESISNYKCTLWGLKMTEVTATNKGKWCNRFHAGIPASNGISLYAYIQLALLIKQATQSSPRPTLKTA